MISFVCVKLISALCSNFRIEDEADYREFLESVASVLCSEGEIGPAAFHKASRGNGVSRGKHMISQTV